MKTPATWVSHPTEVAQCLRTLLLQTFLSEGAISPAFTSPVYFVNPSSVAGAAEFKMFQALKALERCLCCFQNMLESGEAGHSWRFQTVGSGVLLGQAKDQGSILLGLSRCWAPGALKPWEGKC